MITSPLLIQNHTWMKKHILLLLVAVVTIGGCKKEKINNDQANTQQFQGKWKVTHAKITSLKNGQVIETEEEADGVLIFEFAGNALKLTENDQTNGDYLFSVEGDELVIKNNGEIIFFKYKFISGTQLELSQSETVTRNYITYEDKTTYVMSKSK